MRPLRISAISYLNTAPLMWEFEHGLPPAGKKTENPPTQAKNGLEWGTQFEIAYTTPAQCAQQLQTGVADIGIIPAITYAEIPDLAILPDVAIAAKAQVRSILLVSKVPLEQIGSVAADASSRSSVALAQVLFRKFLHQDPLFTPAEPHLDAMLAAADSALLIGDPALRIPLAGSAYHLFDLAELWKRFTGRPFVFAFWAVRMAALEKARPDLDLAQVFRSSRDYGLKPENLAHIAHHWASRVGIPESEALAYLTRNIHYFLDEECLAGLDLFYSYAAECRLIPRAPELRFLATACLR